MASTPDPAAALPLLSVSGICLRFGGVQALEDVSFDVARGQLVSVIGPNGAGKTSLLNCLSGRYLPSAGRLTFAGEDLAGVPASARAARGLARTFQNLALFRQLSVVDNILVGCHRRLRRNVLLDGIFWGPARSQEIAVREDIEHLIDLLEMQPIRDRIAGTLPYGQQKRVELARALAAKPALLLLDEPMAGMNLSEKEDMARFVMASRRLEDVTVLMIEHDMRAVMDLSDRVVVLNFGRVIATGTPDEVAQDPAVRTSYLGDPEAFDRIRAALA